MNREYARCASAHVRRGQTMIEYVLIVSAVAVGVCAAYTAFSGAVGALVHALAAAL